MSKNFYTRVPLDDGTEATVHVNRRGCTGPWTKESDDALRALVQAVHKMTPEEIAAISKRPPEGDTP